MLDVSTWVTDDIRSRYESIGAWTDETWVDCLLRWAQRAPEATAVVDQTGSISTSDVVCHGRRIAAFLYQAGVRSGDVVTVILPNWREFALIHAGVGLAGAVLNPVIPLLGRSEICHILRAANSNYIFAVGEYRGRDVLESVMEAAHDVRGLVGVAGVRAEHGDVQLEDVLQEPWERRVDVPERQDPRSPDTLLFTSGTEAAPKGAVHSHQTAFFGLRVYIRDVLKLTERDNVFMPSPICHATGLQWGMRTSVFANATLVLQDRWDPDVALDLIDEHRCSYTLSATPFVSDLVAARANGNPAGRTLRQVVSGGAPIPRRLVRDVAETLGGQLLAVFGATETYVTTANRPGDPDDLLVTDGRALPGTELMIADEGRPVPPGVDGEIWAKGPHVFLGYVGDPDLTARAFAGEWYRFGDLGSVDETGSLVVTGRIKDVVIRGGQNISVREVEERLLALSSVEKVAVVGMPDERLGERCCAVVVPRDAAHAPGLLDLTSFLLDQGLAKYKLPESIAVVDALPMTATGKVRKVELRASLASGAIRAENTA